MAMRPSPPRPWADPGRPGEPAHPPADQAVLTVVDQRSAYELLDEKGDVVRSVPESGKRRWRVTLTRVGDEGTRGRGAAQRHGADGRDRRRAGRRPVSGRRRPGPRPARAGPRTLMADRRSGAGRMIRRRSGASPRAAGPRPREGVLDRRVLEAECAASRRRAAGSAGSPGSRWRTHRARVSRSGRRNRADRRSVHDLGHRRAHLGVGHGLRSGDVHRRPRGVPSRR